MYSIHIHRIVFELCVTEERKNEDERNWTKWTFSRLVFSALLNVSGTYRVDLAIEEPREVVCRHFTLLCFVFLGAAPILYVQATILNVLIDKMWSRLPRTSQPNTSSPFQVITISTPYGAMNTCLDHIQSHIIIASIMSLRPHPEWFWVLSSYFLLNGSYSNQIITICAGHTYCNCDHWIRRGIELW